MLFLLYGASGRCKSLHYLAGSERYIPTAQDLPNTLWTGRRAQPLPEGDNGHWQTNSKEKEQLKWKRHVSVGKCVVCPSIFWETGRKWWFSFHYLFFTSSIALRPVTQGLSSFISSIQLFYAYFAEKYLLLLAPSSFSSKTRALHPGP